MPQRTKRTPWPSQPRSLLCSKALSPSKFPNKQGRCSETQRKRNKAS